MKYIAGGDARAYFFLSTFTNKFEKVGGDFNNDNSKMLLNATTYKDAKVRNYTEYDIHPELTDFIINLGIVHRDLLNAGVDYNNAKTADTALGKPAFKPIIENIYANWSKIDKKVKDFFLEYFEFKNFIGGTTFNENDYEKKATEYKSNDTLNYNLSFKQVDFKVHDTTDVNGKNLKVPKFINLIPKINFSMGMNQIYALSKFNTFIKCDGFSSEDLKYIYALVFNDNNTNLYPKNELGGINDNADFLKIIQLANKIGGVGAKVSFNDRLKLFGNKLKDGWDFLQVSRREAKLNYITRKEEMEQKETEKLSQELCEKFIIDMQSKTGKIWSPDETGNLYHLVDGKKLYEKEVMLEVCDVGTSCKNFVDQCLLRGNECKDEFGKEILNLEWKGKKIFDTSTKKDNVSLFPPMLLVNVLYVLGFPYKTIGDINYVQDYDYWKKNILPGFEKEADKKWIYDFFSAKTDDSDEATLIKRIIKSINTDRTILNPKLRKEVSKEFVMRPSVHYPLINISYKKPLRFQMGGFDNSIYNYTFMDPFQKDLGYSFVQPGNSVMIRDSGLSGSKYLKSQWANAVKLAANKGINLTNKNQIDKELEFFAVLEEDIKKQISYTQEYVRYTTNTERGRDLKQDNISTRDIPDLKREITMNLSEYKKRETDIAKIVSDAFAELGSALKDKESKIVKNSLRDIINTGW